MKKFSSIILVILMLLTLVACGDKDIVSDDPNLGKWNAISGSLNDETMDIEDLFDESVWLDLKSNGKFILMLEEVEANGKWVYEGDVMSLTGDDIDTTAEIENGILTLINLSDSGMNLQFEKDGGYAGVVTETTADE